MTQYMYNYTIHYMNRGADIGGVITASSKQRAEEWLWLNYEDAVAITVELTNSEVKHAKVTKALTYVEYVLYGIAAIILGFAMVGGFHG